MPLRMQSAARPEFTSYSHATIAPISDVLRERFRGILGVPKMIPVNGIIFSSLATVYHLRDECFIPAVHEAGIYPEVNDPLRTKVLPLPDVFEQGTLTLANADVADGTHFQAILIFRNGSIIHYQTHPLAHDSLYSTISYTSILSVVPNAILKRVQNNNPMIIVHQSVPEDDQHAGYQHSTILRLQRNRQGVIEASRICARAKLNEDQNTVNEEAQRKEVKNSSEVILLLDGYYAT